MGHSPGFSSNVDTGSMLVFGIWYKFVALSSFVVAHHGSPFKSIDHRGIGSSTLPDTSFHLRSSTRSAKL